MAGTQAVRWLDQPEDHDYPAAGAYLALLAPAADIAHLVAVLKAAPQVTFKAKDILRAAGLNLPGDRQPARGVGPEKDPRRKALSPILLVRGDLTTGVPVQVADGYHRVCASYHTDENTDIPCRVAPR